MTNDRNWNEDHAPNPGYARYCKIWCGSIKDDAAKQKKTKKPGYQCYVGPFLVFSCP